MIINVMDPNTEMSFVQSGKQDALTYGLSIGQTGNPWTDIMCRAPGDRRNQTFVNDPAYNAIIAKVYAATTNEDAQKYVQEADEYALQQHWSVNFFDVPIPVFWQSWIKGYMGENDSNYTNGINFTKCWVQK